MKLNPEELQKNLTEIPNWKIENNMLVREINFNSYAETVAFAIRITLLAEKTDHHPDSLNILWKKLWVAYTTHSKGGITVKDFEAAKKIEAMS